VSTQTSESLLSAVAQGVADCYASSRCSERSRSVPASPFSVFSTGAHMKLSFNFKHVDSHKPVEGEVARHVGKLEKLLQSYSPDLIQLHGVFSKTPRTDENSCTLNLSLPNGTLHATGIGATVRTSCKKAFSDLEAQVKKHQAKLRKDYEWRRKRPLPSAEALS
jgi:ribosome-associated translation inhibitor RaiA